MSMFAPEPMGDPMMGGFPAEPDAPAADGPQLLRDAIDVIREYLSVEQDDEDKAVAEQVTTLIQKLLAKQQKEQDGLLQGKMSPGAVRRALSG